MGELQKMFLNINHLEDLLRPSFIKRPTKDLLYIENLNKFFCIKKALNVPLFAYLKTYSRSSVYRRPLNNFSPTEDLKKLCRF